MLKLFHCGYYVSPKNFVSSCDRAVEYYEIEFYVSHNGSAYVNGEKFEPKKDMMLVAKPGDLRHSEGRFACHSVKFTCTDGDLIPFLDGLHAVKNTVYGSEMSALFEHLYKASKQQKELEVDATVRKIISMAYYSGYEERRYPQHLGAIKNAINYMMENADKKISLSDIADAVNLSPTFFHRVFKACVGQTPSAHLQNLRIERAKELLFDNSRSVEQIAEECGFSSRAYFDNVFKLKTGTTPALFRRQVNLTV